MARYIDADKAKHEFNIGFGGVSHAVIANQIIDSIPTADVVEVVRCKDCEHWNGIGFAENAGWCEKKDTGTLYDDFCNYGTPKERGADNG